MAFRQEIGNELRQWKAGDFRVSAVNYFRVLTLLVSFRIVGI